MLVSARKLAPALALFSGALFATGRAPHRALPAVLPNSNVEHAGVLRDRVLTVTLEAKEASWWLNGSNRPPMTIAAFAEPGRAPLIPAPLVRVQRGTEIRLSVHNSLPSPLTFFVPAAVRGGPEQPGAMDSIVVAPGAVGELNEPATAAGNYVYRATTPDHASTALEVAGLLAGAIVIDTAGAPSKPRDRVLVIMQTPDSATVACADTATGNPLACKGGRFVYTIDGRSWPNTERIQATVGDSVHWRVLNASNDVHPMHLHGFYYRVDAFSGPDAEYQGRPAPGQMVVTQLMSAFSGMSMSWSPDRPGNWLFHCHFATHLRPDSISAAPDDPHMRDMIGLVLGVNVAERRGVHAAGAPTPLRHLRLVAVSSRATGGEGVVDVPSMHFVLEERGRRTDTGRDFSPELDLTRGEPVSITVVNQLAEPTSVHWHGIEVEDSYVDGVPGFSGAGTHLAPPIAPGDSFVARFTPPRAGTFMYHAHLDEVRQEFAGLEGAIIVREPAVAASPDDHVFFFKGHGARDPLHPFEINGQADPDTVVLHVGRAARLRLVNLATASPPAPPLSAPAIWFTARPDSEARIATDTMVVRWRPIAKDGFDLPPSERTPRPARQPLGIGETYDFEYTPTRAGTLRLEVRAGGLEKAGSHALLVRVPIRVEE
jgi:FtsP/CotA-like multicopper oxidase with cupredoxin domain